ncbi:hypothetical protein [Natronomonas amylolytica]|uniref:DUF7857 domain-containing protein n=1 Tax=Natronomonas amylolytica TaxID=3108498 RepID=UPI003007FAE4
MPTVTVDTRRTNGVTFVETRVFAEVPHRIRLESRLGGPVWPPRSGGQVAAGWDERGVTREVPAGATGFGFATPAPPTEPAVELTAAEPIAGLPDGIGTWLDRLEERVATAETLADADGLPSATSAVESAGGLAGVEALAAALARDRRTVSRLSLVPEGLRQRIEGVDVPTATLARIADE